MSRIRLPSSGSAFSRLKQVGILQAEDELAVGQLIDAGELHLDDGPQHGRQAGGEIPPESLVQRLQGPHLLLADPLRPLEVVGSDFLPRLGRRAGGRVVFQGRADGRLTAGRHRTEQALDFRLAEHVATHRRHPCQFGFWIADLDSNPRSDDLKSRISDPKSRIQNPKSPNLKSKIVTCRTCPVPVNHVLVTGQLLQARTARGRGTCRC